MASKITKVDERSTTKVECGTCIRCGIVAPVGCRDLNMPFILPDEAHVTLCSECIESLAIKQEEYCINVAEELLGIEVTEAVEEENIVYSSPSKKQSKPKAKKLPKIQTVENHVRKYIIGQDEQVRQILTAIYRARELKSIKSNVLIVGKSGTGKTETLVQIAKKLGLIYSIEDATKYTEEGYVGNSVEDMIKNLIANADFDLEKAENGILIIDEIDKKSGGDTVGRDVSGTSVLKSLLKIIEGTVIPIGETYDEENSEYAPQYFDTSKLIIFVSGAFTGLDKIREKRLGKNSIGFKGAEKSSSPLKLKYIKKDLIEFGVPEEFAGRLDTIVEMNDLTEDDLVEIIKRGKLSAFRKYQAGLKEAGIKLYYPRNLPQMIAKESLTTDTGARELPTTANYIFEKILYDVFANQGKFSKCRLLPGIVTDNTQYILS